MGRMILTARLGESVTVARSPAGRPGIQEYRLDFVALAQMMARMEHRSGVPGVPYAIPYQGSKRKLAPAILCFFPDNVRCLYEPFAGSAAVSLAARQLDKVDRVHLNDLNAPLMQLWEMIIQDPKRLASMYGRLWKEQSGREKEFYNKVRDAFNRRHRPEHFLYLLARCVKAAVRYNRNGEFNQSPDNRRKGVAPRRLASHIQRASELLRGRTTVSALDFLGAVKNATTDDLVYMDPPYQGVCKERDPRYLEAVGYAAFAQGLAQLNDRGLSYIVSYDGRTGGKTHGKPLPKSLRLQRLELAAGRSSQATLLGRNSTTHESLYLSPALMKRIARQVFPARGHAERQGFLFRTA